MKHLFFLSCLVFAVSTPAFADEGEQPLTGAQVRLDDEYAWIFLLSNGPLPEPHVRFGRGELRAWFENVEHQRITTRGDGVALRDVRIRAGAGESTVVHVRFGDQRQLTVDDMAVVPFEGGSAIRFPRSALPFIPEESPTLENESGAEEAAPEEAPLVESDESEETAEESTPLFAAEEQETPPLLTTSNTGSSRTGLLLAIIAGLGAMLVLLKVFAKKKVAPADADIELVSAKRLGPKHQLIVVRALGEEHLLSVSGGQTQLITSSHTALTEEALAEVPSAKPGFESILAAQSARTHQGTGLTQSAERESADERFGARLLDLATGRTDRASVATAPTVAMSATPRAPRLEGRSESAVAGLLDLRRRMG